MIRILKYGAAAIVVILAIVASTLLAARAYLQHNLRKEYRITAANGIEESRYVKLGGVEQWIYIRGQNRFKPVLLFLHGGPGEPVTFVTHEFTDELEKHFVVVHWDQRGAGKSYASRMKAESITKQVLAGDATELIKYLCQRFSVKKVYLVGHSFGSVIGALTARDHPELIHAFVGVAQVVHAMRMEAAILAFDVDRARESGNQEAFSELQRISLSDYKMKDLLTTRKWLNEFGGAVVRQAGISPYMQRGLFFPEYSVVDYYHTINYGVIGVDPDWYQKNWLDRNTGVDLFVQVPRINVPVFFFLGRHDHLTPPELVSEYMRRLDAPMKEIVWFENSGHFPFLEESAQFQSLLIAKLLGDQRIADAPK